MLFTQKALTISLQFFQLKDRSIDIRKPIKKESILVF